MNDLFRQIRINKILAKCIYVEVNEALERFFYSPIFFAMELFI